MVDPRSTLEALCRERGEDYASLSRLIGRNPTYIQQYIKRGSPQKLDEEDRRTLAAYFGISEQRLGGPAREAVRALPAEAKGERRDADLVMVPHLDIGASAGPGALAGDENPQARLGFQAAWLRELTGGRNFTGLSLIRVAGDSMLPTLANGDDILVDRSDAAERLRDGIYVLRVEDALIVKRLALHPAGRGFTILSDNSAYPDWTDCDPASIEVIGRVVWAGRRLG
jgi:phage repressor protein C with HTH and peptisase S24 domain